MALFRNPFSTLVVIFSLLSFCSCKKDADDPYKDLPISADDISINDTPGLYRTTSGYFKLVLQPGNDIGQDAWIDWNEYYSSYANGNAGSEDELKCLAWTIDGNLTNSRTLIRFDKLSSISVGYSIVSAKMFMFGLPASPISLPQGNSYYPGSPYQSYGPNNINVQRITSPWDEAMVTWNTQPTFTELDKSEISSSTSQWNYNAIADVTKIVEYFVNNPSENYGFILSLVNESYYNSMGFCSSEYSVAEKRPKLIIIYK